MIKLKCFLRGHRKGIIFEGWINPARFQRIRYCECLRCGKILTWRILIGIDFGGAVVKSHKEKGRTVIDDISLYEFSITDVDE